MYYQAKTYFRKNHLGKILSIKQIDNALTNRCFKIDTENNSYFLKIFNKDKKNFNRKDEKKITDYLSSIDITFNPLIYDEKSYKYCIYNYVNGSKFSNKDLKEKNIKDLCESIIAIHNADINCNKRNFIKCGEKYLNQIEEETLRRYCSKIKQSVQIIDKIKESLKNMPDDLGLCHNDIHEGNLMIFQDKIYINDLETSSINDIYFDLVCINRILTSSQFDTFIAKYIQVTGLNFSKKKLQIYSCICYFIAYVWYLKYKMFNYAELEYEKLMLCYKEV